MNKGGGENELWEETHPVVYDKSIPLPVIDNIGVNTYDAKGRRLPRFTGREEKQCSVMILDVEVICRRSKHSFSHVVSVCE